MDERSEHIHRELAYCFGFHFGHRAGAGLTNPTSAYSLLGTASNVAAFNSASNHNVFRDTPGLGALADNGGPTQTMAITSSSPAWRVGNPALAVYADVPLNYDQRGMSFERLFSGKLYIGAYRGSGRTHLGQWI